MQNITRRYHAITVEFGVSKKGKHVALRFGTEEGDVLEIALSGEGLLGMRQSISKLAKQYPEIRDWESPQRH